MNTLAKPFVIGIAMLALSFGVATISPTYAVEKEEPITFSVPEPLPVPIPEELPVFTEATDPEELPVFTDDPESPEMPAFTDDPESPEMPESPEVPEEHMPELPGHPPQSG